MRKNKGKDSFIDLIDAFESDVTKREFDALSDPEKLAVRLKYGTDLKSWRRAKAYKALKSLVENKLIKYG